MGRWTAIATACLALACARMTVHEASPEGPTIEDLRSYQRAANTQRPLKIVFDTTMTPEMKERVFDAVHNLSQQEPLLRYVITDTMTQGAMPRNVIEAERYIRNHPLRSADTLTAFYRHKVFINYTREWPFIWIKRREDVAGFALGGAIGVSILSEDIPQYDERLIKHEIAHHYGAPHTRAQTPLLRDVIEESRHETLAPQSQYAMIKGPTRTEDLPEPTADELSQVKAYLDEGYDHYHYGLFGLSVESYERAANTTTNDLLKHEAQRGAWMARLRLLEVSLAGTNH